MAERCLVCGRYKGKEHICGFNNNSDFKKRLSIKFSGKNNPFYGKKHSNETINKLIEIHKNKKHSEVTKLKMRDKRKGRKPALGMRHSEEWKVNHSRLISGKNNYFYDKRLNGDKNQRWLGGKSFEPYSIDFNKKFKNEIRKRDNQVCMNCGIHREKLNKSLSVHHINYDKLLSIEQNCISLCSSCHSLTNINRNYWKKVFQNKLFVLYGYNYNKDYSINIELMKEV